MGNMINCAENSSKFRSNLNLPGELKKYSANLPHIITFQFNSMIFQQ